LSIDRPAVAGLFFFCAAAFAQDLAKGKALTEAQCNSCHPLARAASGYTPEGWDTVLQMMTNHGVQIAPADRALIREYLVATYPERPKPAAALLPGPFKVSMTQWQAATPGSRVHDPLAAHDGMLWYTGQLAGVLGRVDPKTGAVKEFPLKTPHSGPHGLTEDTQGNIWYTGNAVALIGKLDPRTGEVTEHRMPAGQAGDPHTLLFDRSGNLWFTAQNANVIGRLDPRTGEIKLFTPPTPKSRPYGMAFDSAGTLFVVQFGTHRVARVDTKTGEIKEYVLPDAAARPRRVAITPDDRVWYTDYARGYLGRLDPRSGEVKEWRSPSGPKSEPYGISVIDGALWYSESGAKPNTVVRFDPKTERFQTWAIPGGGDIVRNTSVTTDGNFLLANSLVNQITLVRISR
jgi:virginiamycin B lyase